MKIKKGTNENVSSFQFDRFSKFLSKSKVIQTNQNWSASQTEAIIKSQRERNKNVVFKEKFKVLDLKLANS